MFQGKWPKLTPLTWSIACSSSREPLLSQGGFSYTPACREKHPSKNVQLYAKEEYHLNLSVEGRNILIVKGEESTEKSIEQHPHAPYVRFAGVGK